MNVSFEGNFLKAMEERIERWEGDVSAKIVVPASPENYWWAYQEYGIRPHEIPGNPIAFVGNEGLIVKPLVNWTPDKEKTAQGTHSVRTVAATLDELAKEFLPLMFEGNQDNPELVAEQFKEVFMPLVKQEIVDQLEIDLSGLPRSAPDGFPNQGGKLHGQTAAENFAQISTIE